MNDKTEPRDNDLEWENRILCSDESCIGTIGADGRCRECGKAFEGEMQAGSADIKLHQEPDSIGIGENGPAQSPDDPIDVEDDGADDAISDEAWERRTLCRDESCIGVVDQESGCCKECGKPFRKP